MEKAPEAWVQYLVHLRPVAKEAAGLSEAGDDGWFDYTTEARRPAKFPDAVPAVGVPPR